MSFRTVWLHLLEAEEMTLKRPGAFHGVKGLKRGAVWSCVQVLRWSSM